MRFLLSLFILLNTFLFAHGLLTDTAAKALLRIKARQHETPRTSSPQDRVHITARATISRYTDIRGFPDSPSQPMSATDQATVDRAIQQARLIGRSLLSIRRGDALYARIMGDPEFELYDIVMQQVRRVVNILGNADDALPGGERQEDIVNREFVVLRDSIRRHPPPGTDPEDVAATVRGRLIILFDAWFDLPETLFTPGVERDLNNAEVLDRAAESQGSVMFHELLHTVSQGQPQLNQILERARNAGAVIRGISAERIRITDVALNSFRPADSDARGIRRDAEVIGIGIDPNARAYRSDLTSRLAGLTYGRYAAALNADSITLMAVAAVVNFVNTNFHPSGTGPFPPDPPNMPTRQHSIYNDEEFANNALQRLSQNRPIRGSLTYLDKVTNGWLRKDHGGL
ncbi:uncharacterized protein EI97DRAFT_441688 [Westerdykella ornata]|uniref:Uncharacterized protein n=1 Tax=Westerdykella ornata TaxID=318751 RepID=A0A6A6JMF0_WESOR|nr:uncharacterized protein EI97DRAFT_441688 [Westerdykella ornata]KAF2277672.1 hypothetical protein EI97DRAFT_441688 [Westerdykella ornata]